MSSLFSVIKSRICCHLSNSLALTVLVVQRSCNLTDIKLLLLTVDAMLLRIDGVDKAVLAEVTFRGIALIT